MRSDAAIATNNNSLEDTAKVDERPLFGRESPRIVTTSWDDGDPVDLEVARLLADRRLSGTFYIPVKGHHRSGHMDHADVLSLDSQGFEIGAHGVSHPNLPRCGKEQLAVEVESCKKRLEDDLGKEVPMFAYPRGRHSSHVITSVKQAGFRGARTTAMLARDLTFDAFRMPTSVHVFPHSKVDYFRNLARARDCGRAWDYLTRLRRASNWVELAMLLFDTVLSKGGVWHLYGHSWEIKELRLWGGLKVMLDHVANRPGVLYLTNGAVVSVATAQSRRTVVCNQQPAL